MSWVAHTVVDVALGLGLVVAGIHGHGDDYLVLDAAGGYLLLVTVLTKSGAGVWKIVPRILHRLLDGAVSLGLVASPFLAAKYGVRIDAFATAMAEAVGVILLRDAVVSDHRVTPKLSAADPRRGAIEARAFEAGAGVSDVARRAGEVTGRAAVRAKRRALDR